MASTCPLSPGKMMINSRQRLHNRIEKVECPCRVSDVGIATSCRATLAISRKSANLDILLFLCYVDFSCELRDRGARMQAAVELFVAQLSNSKMLQTIQQVHARDPQKPRHLRTPCPLLCCFAIRASTLAKTHKQQQYHGQKLQYRIVQVWL